MRSPFSWESAGMAWISVHVFREDNSSQEQLPCSETWIQPERWKRSLQTRYSSRNSVIMPTEPQAKKNVFLCKSLCQLVVTVQAAATCYISQKLKVLSICRFIFNVSVAVSVHTCHSTWTEARRLLPRAISLFPLWLLENDLKFSGLCGKCFSPLSPKVLKRSLVCVDDDDEFPFHICFMTPLFEKEEILQMEVK